MTPTPPSRHAVSLVATVLNEAATLPALLQSIDAQTRQPDEMVVVDGGSADRTLAILEDWARSRAAARVVYSPEANIAQGRNLAIASSRGDIIAVTDAGVVLDPHWLERLAGALESDSCADVASGFFVPDWATRFERAMAATVLPTLDDVDPGRFLPSSRSVAFRRSAWEAVGGYPEWLDYCEDVVFDLALRRDGLCFVWVPDAVVRYRPPGSLGAFFRQYFRYARGDGKADLWRRRHAARYGAYLGTAALLARAPRSPMAWAILALGGALYLRRPIQRLLAGDGDAAPSPSPPTGGRGFITLVACLALIPVIRLVGDVAKMAGYPVGVAWRARHDVAGSSPEASVSLTASPRPPVRPSPLPTPSLDLSIIVVSYNTRERLRACLASIEGSAGLPECETFVVDNASTDDSADMVERDFPWATLVRSRINGGYACANNLALRRARGRRLLLLNPDAEVGPRSIADMVAYLDTYPEAGAAGPKLVRPDGSLDLACRRSFPSPSVSFYRMLGLSRVFPGSRRLGRYNLTYLRPDVETEVDAVSGAFMLVRREAIEEVGLLDERFFMYGEDLDWAFRMKEQGWRIRYNPRVVVLHHKGESSRQVSQRATVAFFQAMWLFYGKHYRAGTFFALDWLIRLGILSRLGWALLRNALRPPEKRRVTT